MSGDWIKMRVGLHEDPAVLRIAAGLEHEVRLSSGSQPDSLSGFCPSVVQVASVIGHLHRVWGWADQQSQDGVLPGVEASFIDQLTCPGFADQLKVVGWLENGDGRLVFPNFLRHNGVSAKARALDSQRKRVARAADRPPTPPDTTPPAVRQTSGIEPDKNRTREEKSRVEAPIPSPRFARGAVGGVVVDPLPTSKPSPAVKASNGATAGAAVWDAYESSYRIRWGVAPVRNAKANSLCKQFAATMPATEAPDVIRFYLQSHRGLYVSAKHDLTLAVRDAQALRTEWHRGEHGTDAGARASDRTAARGEAFRRIIDEGEGHGHGE